MEKIKYMHISFDDVCLCLNDLIIHEKDYISLFDNFFLKELREFHEEFGAVFTLNCFNRHTEYPDYDISKLPVVFRQEWQENVSWLKFAFHAQNNESNYGKGTFAGGKILGDCPVQISASYSKFVNAVLRAVGTDRALDRVTRLGFFSGTRENVRALAQCPYGIKGLLTADDERISYYLEEEINRQVYENGSFYEKQENLLLLKTLQRLEKAEDVRKVLGEWEASAPRGEYPIGYPMEVFTHETEYERVRQKLRQCLMWAADHGYCFAFVQDIWPWPEGKQENGR